MENDLKGKENYFELTGGSRYRGFELPRFDCTYHLPPQCNHRDKSSPSGPGVANCLKQFCRGAREWGKSKIL